MGGSLLSTRDLRLLLLTLVAVLIGVAGCEDAQNDPLPNIPVPRYAGCSLPDSVTASIDLSASSGEAEVYRLDTVQVNESVASELANKLGVEGSPTYRNMGVVFSAYEVEDADAHLDINATSGIISYRRKAPRAEQNGTPVSDSDAERTAEKFLRDKGLYPITEVEGTVERLTEGLEIRFEPSAIPMASEFPGIGTIVVTLTLDGQVAALIYAWREPRPLGDYPLISESAALDRLRKCQVVFSSPKPDIEVEEVELLYLGLPIIGSEELDTLPEFLVPVYKLVGTNPDTNQPALAIVPAITDEHIRWESRAGP